MSEELQIIISAFGGGALVLAILKWVRFRPKDKVDVTKAQAEANESVIKNFQSLIVQYQDENKLLHATVNELRTEVFRLRDEVKKLSNAG